MERLEARTFPVRRFRDAFDIVKLCTLKYNAIRQTSRATGVQEILST